jgi:NADPH:quinone reductase-like Zn-dependent oxidoreductase
MIKAAVVTRFGSRWSIEIQRMPKPAPAANEVLVRVYAATVNRTDCGELRHPILERLISGRARRMVLGMDFAGEIETTGAAVSAFKPGDRVFGMCPRGRNGAQAEYFCMPETGPIAAMPSAIPFDQAPVCEGAYYAYGSVSKFCITPGCQTLIYGASGAIGTAAVQLAKYFGAHVTAMVATRHLDMARFLGADRVIDYATPEFRKLGKSFDFVLDAVGKMTIRQWRQLVKPDGFFAITDLGPWGQDVPFLLWSAIARRQGQRAAAAARKRPAVRQFPQGANGRPPVPRRRRSKIPPRCDRRRLYLCSNGAKDGHRRDRRSGLASHWSKEIIVPDVKNPWKPQRRPEISGISNVSDSLHTGGVTALRKQKSVLLSRALIGSHQRSRDAGRRKQSRFS